MIHFYWNYKCIWYLLFTTDIHIKYRVTIMKKYQVNINKKINKNFISEIILFDSKLTLKTDYRTTLGPNVCHNTILATYDSLYDIV